jgi:hypothetical protein
MAVEEIVDFLSQWQSKGKRRAVVRMYVKLPLCSE